MIKGRYFSHFTSIEKLKLILKNKTIRFTRLDLVDDISETKILELESVSRLVYVSCWTEDTNDTNDNIALWSMYANNMHGVKIILPYFPFIIILNKQKYYIDDVQFNKDYELKGYEKIKKGDFLLKPYIFFLKDSEYSTFFSKIRYDDNFSNEKEEIIHEFERDADVFAYYSLSAGRRKHKDWEFINEYRYFLLYDEQNIRDNINENIVSNILRNKLDALVTDVYIDIPIHEEALKRMKVIIGPKCNESEVDFIHYIIDKYNKGITIEESKWKNLIR
jgi:hypothetical protein